MRAREPPSGKGRIGLSKARFGSVPLADLQVNRTHLQQQRRARPRRQRNGIDFSFEDLPRRAVRALMPVPVGQPHRRAQRRLNRFGGAIEAQGFAIPPLIECYIAEYRSPFGQLA